MRMNVYLQIFLHNNGQYIYQETNLQNKGVQDIFLHIDFFWLCYLQNKLQNCDLGIQSLINGPEHVRQDVSHFTQSKPPESLGTSK